MKKIILNASPLLETTGGAIQVFESFIKNQKEYLDLIFIGKFEYLSKIMVDENLKSKSNFGGFEPVSIKSIVLIPFSIVIGLYSLIINFQSYYRSDVVIQFTSFSEVFFVYPWLKILGKKIILYNHSNRVPKIFTFTPIGFILKLIIGKSPVVFVSNSQKEFWNQSNMAFKNPIVIHNCVPINDSIQILESKNDVLIKIGFVGRIHNEKRLNILIQALHKVNNNRSIRLSIAGIGDEAENIKKLINSLEFNQNIEFEWLGQIQNMGEFYSTKDLLVFPSSREGFSMVMLEAWSYGLPVLTSDIPSFREIKEYCNFNEKKLIFKLDDINDLKLKLDFFIENIIEFRSLNHKLELRRIINANFEEKIGASKFRNLINLQ